MNHSDHYDSMKIETIDVIQQVMEQEGEMPPFQRHCISHAIRYVMRAGTKSGEPWKKDIEKARNYLHKALTGRWFDTTLSNPFELAEELLPYMVKVKKDGKDD